MLKGTAMVGGGAFLTFSQLFGLAPIMAQDATRIEQRLIDLIEWRERECRGQPTLGQEASKRWYDWVDRKACGDRDGHRFPDRFGLE